MKVGVTGTRSGMTDHQTQLVWDFLTTPGITQLHHGDCRGVDVEVAALALSLGIEIVCHPPVKDELRGWFESDQTREPLNYFARNRNIVDETDFLLVVPFQMSPQKHGGTWYTYSYARKKNKPHLVVYPLVERTS